ncbi:MAG: hypothetical protein QOH11_1768 [Solirubrobacteraceae bacterium]|nr:hypothetical protein [Solirubrobacteraceae bacterium]
MDTTKLRLGELIAGVSAILLFIVMFFHWYGIKTGLSSQGSAIFKSVTGQSVGSTVGVSAWQIYSYTDLLLLLLIILAIGMVVLSATERSAAVPISMNAIVTAFGGLMTLIVLYRLINQPGPNDFVTVKFWGYVGLLLTAGIAVGAFLAMRDEGTSFSDTARRLLGATGGAAAPPPPPAAPPAGQPAPGEQQTPPSQPPPSQPPPGGGAPPTG